MPAHATMFVCKITLSVKLILDKRCKSYRCARTQPCAPLFFRHDGDNLYTAIRTHTRTLEREFARGANSCGSSRGARRRGPDPGRAGPGSLLQRRCHWPRACQLAHGLVISAGLSTLHLRRHSDDRRIAPRHVDHFDGPDEAVRNTFGSRSANHRAFSW